MVDTGWVDQNGDIEFEVINQSGVSRDELDPYMRDLASKLSDWTRGQRARTNDSNLFMRDKYAAPDNPYEMMRTARTAVDDDDVVGSAADVIEGLMLQEVRWESPNADIADVFNQVNAELNLDGYLRTVVREMFTYSQSVTAARWGRRTFVPRNRKGGGAARRKEYNLLVPTKLITLDPLKVVPVGMSIFGEDRLAWNATPDEAQIWDGVSGALQYDPVMVELFAGRYRPRKDEEAELAKLGVPVDNLIELRPDRVWRHTATKASYDRFATVRLRSAFRLLDMKQNLMEADRVTLVGAANYILLVRKGSDSQPAVQQEIANLKENFKSIAKLPVVISDHRLQIDIITPSNDTTLDQARYDVLDGRILSQVFKSMDAASSGGGEQGGQVRTRMMSRALETQRKMLRRAVEAHVSSAIWSHPANAEMLKDIKPDEKPSLAFMPRNIQVDNDSQVMQAIMQLRQSKELSRETALNFFGFDQDIEAQRRELEEKVYDDIFGTIVPHGSPGSDAGGDGKTEETDTTAGRRGGRPTGGGKSPNSVSGVRPKTSSGSPKK